MDYWANAAEGRGWTLGLIFIFGAQQYEETLLTAKLLRVGGNFDVRMEGAWDGIWGTNADLVPTF